MSCLYILMGWGPQVAQADPFPVRNAPTDPSTIELQDIAQLEVLARSEALREFPALTGRQRLQVGPVEPNSRRVRCTAPIKPRLASPHHMKDRLTVELRCEDYQGWHLYVPVRIMGTSPVAVAVHAIIMGSIIQTADLRVEEHDIADLPPGFLDDPSIAVGLTAARPIAGGAYISNQQLLTPKAVQRGQSVTLLADAGGMSIRMAGRALTDGMVNQRVKVTNLSSGKIVEGIARSQQIVEIILQ